MAKHSLFLLLAILAIPGGRAAALEQVVLRREGRETEITGRLVVRAEDEGMLILARDGVLWTVPPEELVRHQTLEAPFEPLSRAELEKQLLSELPAGFRAHATQHYLVCHNTPSAYAVWCGALLERLYFAFVNYWTRKGFELEEPQFPLVAVVFADRESYLEHARQELGDAAEAILGYYSLRSNRVNMYDLTGVAGLRRPGDRRSSAGEINAMLARPQAERTVATVVHEATHQIAFNCGLQTRYSDVPLWLSEGMAIYFETPDLKSAKGWRNIGAVNRVRLAGFRDYLPRRPADSLVTLIADDRRLRDRRQADDAYAEAWALNYFLIRHRPDQYLDYLAYVSRKRPLIWDEAETRLAEFQRFFGGDLAALDADFVRQMAKVAGGRR